MVAVVVVVLLGVAPSVPGASIGWRSEEVAAVADAAVVFARGLEQSPVAE